MSVRFRPSVPFKSKGYSDVALLIFGSVFSLYQICTTVLHDAGLRKLLSVLRKMFGRKMRVTPDHLCRLPSTKLLQHMQRCSLLNMPRCPRVAQIVPAEVFRPGTLHRITPRYPVGRRGLTDKTRLGA